MCAAADIHIGEFEAEARAHLDVIERAMLRPDALKGDENALADVFRAAHSIKGTASFFALDKIVSLAHATESVLAGMRDGLSEPNEEIADAVLRAVDKLGELTADINACDGVEIADTLAALEQFAPAKGAGGVSETAPRFSNGGAFAEYIAADPDKLISLCKHKGQRLYYINLDFSRKISRYYFAPEDLFGNIMSVGRLLSVFAEGKQWSVENPDALTEMLTSRERTKLEILCASVLEPDLFKVAAELEDISEIEEAPPKQEKSAPGAGRAEDTRKKRDDGFLRLRMGLLNELIDLSGELVIVKNQLNSVLERRAREFDGLTSILQTLDRLVGDTQEKVMQTRMQPVDVIFSQLPRVARDMGRTLDKQINPEIRGGSLELDKFLIDALSDPLIQIVKNSIDHGIESRAVRLARGKDPVGTVRVSARAAARRIIIEVSDDGGGADVEKLKQKAVERDPALAGEIESWDRKRILALMFEPGLSTASEVSNLSGRGVGMDIVRNNIEELGGTIEVESADGAGMTTIIESPLTISVLPALIVETGGAAYAIPRSSIERFVRVPPNTDGGTRIERAGGFDVLNLRSRLLPIVSLSSFGGENVPLDITETRRFAVLRSETRSFALSIDKARAAEELLVKPLPAPLKDCACYANVSVLGSGEPVLILDADGIAARAGLTRAEDTHDAEIYEQDCEPTARFVIFQCSGNETFAADEARVSRIEEVRAAAINEAGGRLYVNVRDTPRRAVCLEDYLSVSRGADRDLSAAGPEDTRYLITTDCYENGGLLVSRIVDDISADLSVRSGPIEGEMLLGSAAYGDMVLLIPDLERIFAKVRAEDDFTIAEGENL